MAPATEEMAATEEAAVAAPEIEAIGGENAT